MYAFHFALPFALISLASLVGAQTTLPYFEDFETSDGGFVNDAAPSEWEWGTPSSFFISQPGNGTRSWVTDLDTSAGQGMHRLTSPVFDFSSLVEDPFVQFLHIFDTPGSLNGYVDISIDGGAYTRLGSSGAPASINWYNSLQDTWNGNSPTAGAWQEARVRLDGTAGASAVQLQFVVESTFGAFDDGMGIDDFRIFQGLTDVEVQEFVGPLSGPELSESPVSVRIKNNGTSTLSSVDLTYVISGSGSASVTETFSGTIVPQGEFVYVFDELADLSVIGEYQLDVSVSALGDEVPSNDATSTIVVNQATIDSLPFFEDFESGRGQFIVDAPGSQWEYGDPSGQVICAAAGGVGAWVTELAGAYAPTGISYLQSPPIDLRGEANDPFLEFDLTYQIDFSDGLYVEVSYDGGAFARLGTSNADVGSINWYSFSNEWDGTSFPAGAWQTTRHLLDGAGGTVAVVRWVFRATQTFSLGEEGVGIDNVQVYRAPFGVGQRPRSSVALLDVNEATEAIGFPVTSGQPGPYFTSVSVMNDSLDIRFDGVPNQAAILYYGELNPALVNLGGLGQIDIANPILFASGLLSGGINTFFMTNPSGEFEVSLSIPSSFAGLTTTLQGAVTNPSTGFALTNAVEVTFAF